MAYTSPYEVGSTEWLEAMDYPEQYRSEVKTYRAMALKQGIVKKPVDPTVPQDRKAALDAIEREFGEWTYFDAITVIAGGKKHTVPAGTVSESEPLRGGRRVRPAGWRLRPNKLWREEVHHLGLQPLHLALTAQLIDRSAEQP